MDKLGYVVAYRYKSRLIRESKLFGNREDNFERSKNRVNVFTPADFHSTGNFDPSAWAANNEVLCFGSMTSGTL